VTESRIDSEHGEELPGSEILREGLRDLRAGVASVHALLVQIARPRLERLGIELPGGVSDVDVELTLYRRLREEAAEDAYGQYNAWLRRLARLCRALEARAARGGSAVR
jgi:hypothetical protein